MAPPPEVAGPRVLCLGGCMIAWLVIVRKNWQSLVGYKFNEHWFIGRLAGWFIGWSTDLVVRSTMATLESAQPNMRAQVAES